MERKGLSWNCQKIVMDEGWELNTETTKEQYRERRLRGSPESRCGFTPLRLPAAKKMERQKRNAARQFSGGQHFPCYVFRFYFTLYARASQRYRRWGGRSCHIDIQGRTEGTRRIGPECHVDCAARAWCQAVAAVVVLAESVRVGSADADVDARQRPGSRVRQGHRGRWASGIPCLIAECH